MTALDLSVLSDGDTGVFATARSREPNEYIPYIKASMAGKDQDGNGKPKAFPLPWGDMEKVVAKMRRAARDCGVGAKFRWLAADAKRDANGKYHSVRHTRLIDNLAAVTQTDAQGSVTNADSKEYQAALRLFNASPGNLHFFTHPQVHRRGAAATVDETKTGTEG